MESNDPLHQAISAVMPVDVTRWDAKITSNILNVVTDRSLSGEEKEEIRVAAHKVPGRFNYVDFDPL